MPPLVIHVRSTVPLVRASLVIYILQQLILSGIAPIRDPLHSTCVHLYRLEGVLAGGMPERPALKVREP